MKYLRQRTLNDLERGLFFEMRVETVDPTATVLEGSRIHYQQKCSLHKSCRTCVVWEPLLVAFNRPPGALFQCATETQAVLGVSERLRRELLAAEIKGFKSEPITVEGEEVRSDSSFYQLIVNGRRCEVAAKVYGGDNECPHCGGSPVVCEETGEVNVFCPACHMQLISFGSSDQPDGDVRFVAKPNKDNPVGRIISGKRWGGEDLLFGAFDNTHGHLVSIRAKRVIEEIAESSRIQFRDAFVDVSGIDDEQKARLAALR